jgi:hypothetical protein
MQSYEQSHKFFLLIVDIAKGRTIGLDKAVILPRSTAHSVVLAVQLPTWTGPWIAWRLDRLRYVWRGLKTNQAVDLEIQSF